jgi:hypothetical protein
MKVEYEYEPIESPVSLTQFAEQHGLILMVRKNAEQRSPTPLFDPDPPNYTVMFKNSSVGTRHKLDIRINFGIGHSPKAAADHYVMQISGCSLWVTDIGNIQVPTTLFNDWDGGESTTDNSQEPSAE